MKNKKISPKTIAVIVICALVVISFAIAFLGIGINSCHKKREDADLMRRIEEMTEEPFAQFTFPSSGIAALLPVPKSDIGRIEKDSSDYFRVTVAETLKKDFKEYIEKCKEKGFTVDYDNTDSRYSAYNEEGYYLRISFDIDESTMEITLEAPKQETEKPTEKPTEAPATQAPQTKAPESKPENNTPAVNQSQIRDEVKEAIDSYESFVDEYCAFMKNYDSSDLTSLTQYMEFLSKEVEMAEKFEAIEDMDLTEAEEAYYLEVSLRCSQKMLDAAAALG